MSIWLNKLHTQLMAEAGEADGGGGGAVDRGDDFQATGDDAADAGAADKGAAAEENVDENAEGTPDGAEDKGAENEEGTGEQSRGKDGKFGPKVIPKARFDEVRQKAKDREAALMARITELEKATAREVMQQDVQKLEDAVVVLEDQYQKLLDEGKTAEAKVVMREIRLKERQIVEVQVEHKSERARQMAVEQFKVDSLVEKLESEFPQLNPDTDEYDQEVVDEVMLLRTSFEKNGLTSSQAIAKAVKYVLGAAQKAAPPAATDTKPKGLNNKSDERARTQLRKNIDAASRQPGRMDDAGLDSNKKGGALDSRSVSEMTEEEFDALPASTKARLRGDVVEDVAS